MQIWYYSWKWSKPQKGHGTWLISGSAQVTSTTRHVFRKGATTRLSSTTRRWWSTPTVRCSRTCLGLATNSSFFSQPYFKLLITIDFPRGQVNDPPSRRILLSSVPHVSEISDICWHHQMCRANANLDWFFFVKRHTFTLIVDCEKATEKNWVVDQTLTWLGSSSTTSWFSPPRSSWEMW